MRSSRFDSRFVYFTLDGEPQHFRQIVFPIGRSYIFPHLCSWCDTQLLDLLITLTVVALLTSSEYSINRCVTKMYCSASLDAECIIL